MPNSKRLVAASLRRSKRELLLPVLFIAPALAVLLSLSIYPLIYSVTISLQQETAAGVTWGLGNFTRLLDRKSTRLNSSHTVIYTLSLHDALPISSLAFNLPAHLFRHDQPATGNRRGRHLGTRKLHTSLRSEEHTSELQSHSDLHSFPTRRSSDLFSRFQSTRSSIPSRSACNRKPPRASPGDSETSHVS